MKIATTTRDFHAYVSHTMDVCTLLPWLAESGFRHIDMNFYSALYDGSPVCGDSWEKWTDNVLETADSLGLDFVQAHASNTLYNHCAEREWRMEMIRRQLRICQRLGIGRIVLHGVTSPESTREDFIRKNVEMYGDLLRTAEETGVTICTENTCYTNYKTYYIYEADDFHALDEALGRHPLFGMCWDVGHANVQGVGQYREITRLGDRLKAVHIHDNVGMRGSPEMMDLHQQPYAGCCNYDAIVKALKDIGFGGTFTLEAYSIPEPVKQIGREPLILNGTTYDRLQMLPLRFKLTAEQLMHDITRHMLEAYDCYEE